MIRVTLRCRAIAWTTYILSLSLSTLSFAATPPPLDPCKVVTVEEVEQAIGKLKGTPRIEKLGDTAQCIYEFSNATSELDIWIGTADSLAPARKRAKQPVAVNGIGDEAIMDRGRIDTWTVELHIRKGKQVLLLMLSDTPGDEAKLKTLAQKAVGRF